MINYANIIIDVALKFDYVLAKSVQSAEYFIPNLSIFNLPINLSIKEIIRYA